MHPSHLIPVFGLFTDICVSVHIAGCIKLYTDCIFVAVTAVSFKDFKFFFLNSESGPQADEDLASRYRAD